MARAMPATLVDVTGLRNINSEKLITAIRLDALATAYVSGVTNESIHTIIEQVEKLHSKSRIANPT